MKKQNRTLSFCFGILLGMLPLVTAADETSLEVSFLYPLSNFSGPVPSIGAKLAVDPELDEVYAMNPRKKTVQIFNETGMETFSFGENFPGMADISIGDQGDIFLLTGYGQTAKIHRTNYRGELVETITLKNIPHQYSNFAAVRLVYRGEFLYLIDPQSLAILVVDKSGNFEEAHNLRSPLRRFAQGDRKKLKELKEIDFTGFDVDQHGNMFFTIPSMFTAFRLSPAGELAYFGRSGSAPGKFGVVSGIAVDDMGNIYVSDRLRCVVLIFNSDFVFQKEFGHRGYRPSNLIVPMDVAISSDGKVYVSQAGNRGVSVFKVVYKGSPSIEKHQLGDSSLELTQAEVEEST